MNAKAVNMRSGVPSLYAMLSAATSRVSIVTSVRYDWVKLRLDARPLEWNKDFDSGGGSVTRMSR